MLKAAVISVVLIYALMSCTKDSASECTAVSFQKDIWPIVATNCNLPACHTAATSNGIVLDSAVAYTNMTKSGTGYIQVGNPSNSLLYEQMISLSQPMPPSGALDASITSKIKCWILQGAKND